MIVETDGGWASLLLPFLILVIIGVIGVIVWLVWVLTRSGKKKPQVGGQPDRPPVAQDADEIPFLVIQRSSFGDWALYVHGQRIRRMAAVTDPAEREELFAALRFLITFAKGDGVAEQSQSAPHPGGTPDVRPTEPSDAAGTAPTQPPPGVERRERYSRTTAAESTGPAIDLVQEINDILDEMIATSPEMRGHSIGLIHVPAKGIRFAIDGKVYDDLSEIPSPEIRAVIRKATKEWERR